MEVSHVRRVPSESCFIEPDAVVEELETLRRDLSRTQEANVGLQLKQTALQSYVQDLESKLRGVYQETQLHVGDLAEMLGDTEERIKELETSYDLNCEEKIESETQLKHTEHRLLNLCKSLDETEADNFELEKKLGDAQNQIQKVEGRLNLAIKTKSHLTNQLEETEGKVQMLRQEVSLLHKVGLERQRNLKWCEREMRNKQNVASELLSNSSQLRQQNDQLNTAVNKLQSEVQQFEKAHVLLQEEFFQTQTVLDEVQSGYKVMAEERAALSEELQLFYEKHQEVRSDYQLCMYEKHEREQEIALLKQHLEKIEREMYEITKTKCANSDGTNRVVGVVNGYQELEVEGEGMGPSRARVDSADDIDIERPLRELSSHKSVEEVAEVEEGTLRPIPNGHASFCEPPEERGAQHHEESVTADTKVGLFPKGTWTNTERKELDEMMDSFQRGWMEAIKLKSFREEQVTELLNKVARLELQIASLTEQNSHLQQLVANSSNNSRKKDVETKDTQVSDREECPLIMKLSSDISKHELIQIIQKLDRELEETKEDLLTARVFNDNFVEYKVKLCRKFRKEESKLYAQEKELCRSKAETLRLQTEVALYKIRLESMTARLDAALSDRDHLEKELAALVKN